MGLSGGPVAVGQPCVSPAITEAVWVTRANTSSSVFFGYTDEHTIMHSSMSFRATDNGSLFSGDSLLANPMLNGNGVVSIPSSGNGTMGKVFTGSVSVKRPSCICTQLHGCSSP